MKPIERQNLTGKPMIEESSGSATDNIWAIKAINLTKRFGKRLAVDNLNLSIRDGELYALLGDNGAGKTTTLGMLTTLIKPSAGTFYICGLNGLTQSEETKGVFGVVSQDIAIYNELTARENLQFISSLYKLSKEKGKRRMEEVLNLSGLADRADDPVHTFSGGMQRRLSIAAALLHQPQVLFMDEPTVGLDPMARRQIWATLSDLREQGVTILLTTHYLEEAEILCDRVGIIRLGKLVAEGTMEELRDKIQAMRNIEVRLSRHLSPPEVQATIASALSKLGMQSDYDAIHNTLLLAPTEMAKLDAEQNNKTISQLRGVLKWLETENIPFANFATHQPSLEEIFLAVTEEKNT
jgi:ABC-2 type transport system ATP-binding protein